MSRLLVFTCLASLALGAAGCRAHHLGDKHGRAYAAGFGAQARKDAGRSPAPLDAADAENIVQRHHRPQGDTDAQGAGAPLVLLGQGAGK